MMMTISILVFILFLCCTVFLKGSLLGGILGMALAAGAAALAVLRNGTSFSSVRTVRRKPS